MSLGTVEDAAELDELVHAFHATHREVFKSADPHSPVEFESWHARARCRISTPSFARAPEGGGAPRRRPAYFHDLAWVDVDVWRLEDIPFGKRLTGPAIVESDTTIVVVDGTSKFWRSDIGSLWVAP